MYAIRSYYVLHIVPKAFELALSGRPGPVWIDVPKDVQLGEVTFADWPEAGKRLEARITSYNVCYTKLLRTG